MLQPRKELFKESFKERVSRERAAEREESSPLPERPEFLRNRPHFSKLKTKTPAGKTEQPSKEDVFGKQGYVSTKGIKSTFRGLRKNLPKVPGTGKFYTRRELTDIEQSLLSKAGRFALKSKEYRKAMKGYKREVFGAKTLPEQLAIKRKLDLLKKHFGSPQK